MNATRGFTSQGVSTPAAINASGSSFLKGQCRICPSSQPSNCGGSTLEARALGSRVVVILTALP
jgi:hypothetical protein